MHLKDHIEILPGMEEYVSDYKARLFEIAFLSEEQVKLFKSDFRFVAEYFVASRRRKEGKTPDFTITLDHLKHVDEFIELMNAVTNSDRFSMLPDLLKEHGGNAMKTILFDEAEKRGEARGEARGEIKGAIKIYHDEMKLDPLEIVRRIMARFSLKEEAAEKQVAEALGLRPA